MARTVLSIAGAVVGFFVAGPYGAMIGSAIGGTIGAYLEPPDDIHGPRLEDRRVQLSSYGSAIPFLFGTTRVAGNVIWADELEEVASEEEVGGKGGPGQTIVSYSYFGTFAVLMGFGRCRGVRRIWADAVLIYDSTIDAAPSVDFDFVFYGGSEEQLPDPTIEAALGVGSTPAFRGFAYLVLNRLPLERFGNRLPTITAEVIADGEWQATETELGAASAEMYQGAEQRLDGQVVAWNVPSAGHALLQVIDPTTGEVTAEVDHAIALDSGLCYVPPLDEVWLGRDGYVERFNAQTLAHVGTITVGSWAAMQLAYDPVRRQVLAHRDASAVNPDTYTAIALDGTVSSPPTTEDASQGLEWCSDIITGGSEVVIAANGLHRFGVLRAEVAPGNMLITTQATGGSNMGCWDASRSRYVMVGGTTVYTVSDSTSPTIASYSPSGMTGATPQRVQYLGGLDAIAVYTSVVGLITLTLLDADTFEVLFEDSPVSTNGITNAFLDLTDPGRVFVLGTYQPYSLLIYGTTVGAAVARLCDESGLESGDYNVAALTMPLRGYFVGQQSAARGAVEQLAITFLFEGAEVDDVLVFRLRGGASVATIASDEGGVGLDEAAAFAYERVRADEIDLPARLTVTAPDPATDHQPGTQSAERLANFAGEQEQLQVAVVLSADEGKQLADALLFDRWAGRERGSVSLTRKYARLVPTDPVTLDGRRVRILSRSDEGGVLRLEWIADDADVIEQTSAGVQGTFPGQSIAVTVPTTLVLLDTALLRDADDSPGAYAAAWGIAPHWRGAAVVASDDAGATWAREFTMPAPGSSVGITTDALGDFTGGAVFDEVNTVNVSMRNGAPASATRAAVLAGSNYAAISGADGWEVFQYRDVTLEDDGTYTLGGLLRGRRGTEFAIGGHAARDTVVLLAESSIRTLDIESSQIGVSRAYRPVSVGDTIAATAEQDETIAAERLKPWAPVNLRAARASDGAITLTWTRRTRLSCRFTGTGGINTPLGEDGEAYEVEIFNGAGYASVVRTLTGLSSEQASYTAAQQVTDFGSTQSVVYVRVYQLSATVDRGHQLQAAA